MKRFPITLRTRIALAFGVMLVLTVVLGSVSLWRTSLMKNSYEFVSTNTLSAVRAMSAVSSSLEAMRRSELRLLSLTPGGQVKEEENFINSSNEVKKYNVDYSKNIGSDSKAKAFLDAFNTKLDNYLNTHRILVETSKSAGTDPDKQDALADYLYSGDNFKANNEVRDALKDSEQYSYLLADSHRNDAGNSYSAVWHTVILFSVLTVSAGIVLSILITRGLVRQLGCEPADAVRIAGHIATGDLTVDIQVGTNDQSSLLYAIKAMRDSIVSIVSEVRLSTETISVESKEIADGNLDLSARAEAQAGALEETAATMEELTGTVKQNAENARQANAMTQEASQTAAKSGAVVALVVDTMGAINASAKKITDIISVIDGIAFQTNILALNAAVEAARAGEQGRGFAVVASEVRNLAQRSAAAAREIKTLIGDSVDKVDIGSKLVDQAGISMKEVVGSILRITDVMAEITSASQEQTQGIEQVNQAIAEMDNVTQQNATLVEHASSAAAAMHAQAEKLLQVVSIFKLTESSTIREIGGDVIGFERRDTPALELKRVQYWNS